MSKIIDAVSIVITYEDEVFIIQRQNFLNAFPGYWAFPGGKVEAIDSNFEFNHPIIEGIDLRLFGALVREGNEELGVDFSVEIAKGGIKSVSYLGLAITPDFNPYRFSTYFFKIDLRDKIGFLVDHNEAQVAEWRKAHDLLNQYQSGEFLAVPPIIKVIEELGRNPNLFFIGDLNLEYDEEQFVPYIESLKGIRQLMPLSHTLPPANRTNAFLIGDDSSVKIIIDPSPMNNEEYRKFKNTLSLFDVDKILITHHHPDHFEYSNTLAKELNLPVLMSQKTFSMITQKNPNYFDSIELELLKEGDVVTKWLGYNVMIMEIPGHDEGQIAVYSENRSWFLAGDLFQGIGSVVIGGPEGDMKKYFDTLERIIKFSPKVVFPSHGIGLGGVNILEKNLKHRKERESQVLSCYREGMTPEEMLGVIYADVDKKLWPYAMENIQKHLKKLRDENIII